MSRPALAALAIALTACLPVAAQDSGWPVEIQAGEYAVTLYQPQVDSFTEDLIEGRAAAAIRKGDGEPIFGAVWLVARIVTDRDTRNVDILTVEVPAVRFPEATEEEQQLLADLLERELPNWDVNLSLDSLLASLEDGIQNETVGGQEGKKKEQQQSCPQARERQPGGPFAELVVETSVHQTLPSSGCEQYRPQLKNAGCGYPLLI